MRKDEEYLVVVPLKQLSRLSGLIVALRTKQDKKAFGKEN